MSALNRDSNNPRPDRRPATNARGVALLAVLWVVLLLSVIAGSLLMLTRTDIGLSSRNLIDGARAAALADGGITLGILGLLDPDPQTRWKGDGREYELVLDSGLLAISIQDEAGRIDLNMARPELLAGLLRSAGVEEDEAARLSERIVDWRDPDDQPLPNGAEASDYRAEGLDLDVANRPFITPDEIQRVPGVTMAVYARIAPAVTVYSRRPGVNPATAPLAALMALPGVDEASMESIIAGRISLEDETATSRGASGFGAAVALIPSDARRYLSGGISNVYTISARATLNQGGVYVQEAVVELIPGGDPPWRIHAWRPGEVTAIERPAPDDE